MSSWRDTILNDFVPNVNKLTLVADPDSLLTEEKLTLKLRMRGFDLIEFNDIVEFRYAYESRYRSILDKDKSADLIVILRLQDTELESLPYDLLQEGRKLSFNLGNIFPNLSYFILDKLDRSYLDSLFNAQQKFQPDIMGDHATEDFILRHVFGIAAELVINEIELLRVLLRLHYKNIQLPLILNQRLIHIFKSHNEFKTWPLDAIVSDSIAFFNFLQERWPLFLSRHTTAKQVKDGYFTDNFKYSGPEYLPFDHQDIKVYMDNLFLEGKLRPIEAMGIEKEVESWIQSGIASTSIDNNLRISRLFGHIEKELPTTESRHTDWADFAIKWAELSALVHCSSNTQHQLRLKEFGNIINGTFAIWLSTHYAGLINLPPTNPVMLHHIPRRLVRDIEKSKNNRVALIVIDGLALDQWISIKQLLQQKNTDLIIRESSIFAWIPTLTSISRQSIFAGKPPLYFGSSINSTNSEEKLWKQFWEDAGLSRLNVAYQRGLGDGDISGELEAIIHPDKTKVIGLIIDKVDKIMHGMQLGASGMHNQIKQWCQNGFLNTLIEHLLDNKYEVWLTSDHGNIECKGTGRLTEGSIADIHGERVRVYPSQELRSKIATSFTSTHEWQPVGLPSGYFPLFADGHDAFINPNISIVGHGGISIEEVIVPLIKFERKVN